MSNKRYSFDHKREKTAGAGSNDLEFERVAPAILLCVQHITIENETTVYDSLRILKEGAGEEHFVIEQLTPQAARLYWHDEPIYLKPGQRLVCRLAGCTVSDKIRAYASGWFIKISQGQIEGGIDNA